MRVQYYSDTHLELIGNKNSFKIPKVTGEVLALLGDIGTPSEDHYINFLNTVSKLYLKVFVILGNHEYYRSSFEEIDSLIKTLKLNDNVHILQNESYDYNGVRFLGSTLWSNIPQNAKFQITRLINDYRLIEGSTVDLTNSKHLKDLEWLHKEIIESTLPVVVLTHHAPLDRGTSAPQYELKEHVIRHAFATDLSEIIFNNTKVDTNNLKIWLSGHTHYSYNFVKFGIQFASNQIGYRGEKTGFLQDSFVEIK